MTKRGLIFSLTAIFLFVALISSGMSISNRVSNENRLINQDIPSRVDRGFYQTISNDLARLQKTRVENGLIIEEMPCDVSSRVSDYEAFLINVLDNYTTSEISLSEKNNGLMIGNHTFITYDSGKTGYRLTSNETLTYYGIIINSSQNTSLIQSDIDFIGSGLYLNLTIRSVNGTINELSGYLNTSRINTYNITYDNGEWLNLTLNNELSLSTNSEVNTSLDLNMTDNVYTLNKVKIESSVLESIKEYNSLIR